MSTNHTGDYAEGKSNIPETARTARISPETSSSINKSVSNILSTSHETTERDKSLQSLIESGLWPQEKTINSDLGNPELEALGYVHFYTGKNADLYIIPNTDPIQILMIRTDRTSVFNIPLDLEIEWKWIVQNQISIQWANFAERYGIKTAMRSLPENIPTILRGRSQAIELCKQLEIEIDGKTEWMELIFRNYITGSLYKMYAKWENPYKTTLPAGLTEWADIRDEKGNAHFTPTDKTKDDNPIPSHIVEDAYPEIVKALQNLFQKFTEFADFHGYVLIDTKFEVFINSRWEWILGDEILTPESSRFILRENFNAGIYTSADKQYIRELGKKFWWEEKWKQLKSQNPQAQELKVSQEVTQKDKNTLLEWYTKIQNALKTALE